MKNFEELVMFMAHDPDLIMRLAQIAALTLISLLIFSFYLGMNFGKDSTMGTCLKVITILRDKNVYSCIDVNKTFEQLDNDTEYYIKQKYSYRSDLV